MSCHNANVPDLLDIITAGQTAHELKLVVCPVEERQSWEAE